MVGPAAADEAIARAAAHFAAGRLTEAIAELRRCLVQDPAAQIARRNLAICLDASGQWKEARGLYRGLLAEDPIDAGVLVNLACAYVRLGYPATAYDTYRKALAVDPRNRQALQGCQVARIAEGRPEDAIKAGQRALGFYPDDPVLLEDLCKCALLLGVMKPGALLRLGLYSRRVRRDVLKLRALLEADTHALTPSEIRAMWELVFSAIERNGLQYLLRAGDLYSTSGFRDFCLNRIEQQFDIDGLAALIDGVGLGFVRMNVAGRAAGSAAEGLESATPPPGPCQLEP
ncbi:MAG: tetratricopeptide repeat protein [Proteobacteria bacterium]|nr:tetratricopeptide repeat protein [Pseudomonadota bacterium]